MVIENDIAKCLVCYKMLNKISKYNLQRHNTLFHAKDFDKHKDNECTCVVRVRNEIGDRNETFQQL